MIFIALMILVAILGPFIRPDHSTHANEQHLQIAKQKPGFEVQVLRLPRANFEPTSFWNKISSYGWDASYSEIPIAEYEIHGDSIYATEFTPYELKPEDRILHVYAVADLPDAEQLGSNKYVLGTDKLGRDLLSRLMGGTAISLSVGLIAVLISLLVGITLGAIAGYYRGWVDNMIMWLINVVWSIPTLLLVMAIVFAFGKGFDKVFIAVGLTMWVEVARIVRGQILSIREKEFIEACRALGYSNFRIITKHILPNVLNPVIVISAANFSAAILIEAGLSFLGIGAQIPTPSWGNMIKEHYSFITTDYAYLALLPGVMIMLMVLSFMLVGNGLRDALDIRSTSR
jgi:peptide/nickel transport system permease protein